MDENSLLILGFTATATSFAQNASGWPLVRRMWRERDATRVSPWPCLLLTGTVFGIGLFGVFVAKRVELVLCNALAYLAWIPFVISYVKFASPAAGRRFLAAYFTIIVVITIQYLVLFPVLDSSTDATSPAVLSVAIPMQAFNIAGFASPCVSILAALRSESATNGLKYIERALAFINVVNSSLWIVWGASLSPPDAWIWAPNICGVLLGGGQLAVVAVLMVRARGEVPPPPSKVVEAGEGRQEGLAQQGESEVDTGAVLDPPA